MQLENSILSLITSDLIVYNGDNEKVQESLPRQEVVEYEIVSLRHNLRPLSAVLKMHSLLRVTNAIDLTVVDFINYKQRFNLTYQLQSVTTNTRWNISTWASELDPILSLQTLFPAFNWAEREAWDMYGTFFVKHPDLRRILTDYGFSGFPLRKDFPLSGFKEVQYEDIAKQVEYSKVEFAQSYRLLSFTTQWKSGV